VVLELNLKKLEKVAFENATHSQEFLMKTKLEKAAHSQKAPTLENAGFFVGGGARSALPNLLVASTFVFILPYSQKLHGFWPML
jgi:hypothetical protein